MDPLPKLTEIEEPAETGRPLSRCVEGTPSPTPQPFWGRFTRALSFLLVASSAHLWLHRVPQRPDPQAAIGPVTPLVSSDKLPGSADARDNVGVLTNLVAVGTSGRATPSPAKKATASPPPEGLQVRMARAAVPPRPVKPQSPGPPRDSSVPRYDTRPASILTQSVADAPQGAPLSLIHTSSALTKNAGARMQGTRADEAALAEDQQQLVRRLLQDYVSAFERLDVHAAKAVWPTVDDKALRHAFEQLEAQHLTFDSCGITIEGAGANARCQGEATYRVRVGSRAPRSSPREWIFNLARAETGWRIVDATVR